AEPPRTGSSAKQDKLSFPVSLVSTQYGLFLVLVCTLCWLGPARTFPVLVLGASAAFYAFGGLIHLPLLAMVGMGSYRGARLLASRSLTHENTAAQEERRPTSRGARAMRKYGPTGARKEAAAPAAEQPGKPIGLLWMCILLLLAPLVYYRLIRPGEIPVGISFFTLQAIGYVVDVYREEAALLASFPLYASFLAFFPLVLSGPIERASHLIPQLVKRGEAQVTRGVFLILSGIVLKCVVADNLAKFVNTVYSDVTHQAAGSVLLACYFY